MACCLHTSNVLLWPRNNYKVCPFTALFAILYIMHAGMYMMKIPSDARFTSPLWWKTIKVGRLRLGGNLRRHWMKIARCTVHVHNIIINLCVCMKESKGDTCRQSLIWGHTLCTCSCTIACISVQLCPLTFASFWVTGILHIVIPPPPTLYLFIPCVCAQGIKWLVCKSSDLDIYCRHHIWATCTTLYDESIKVPKHCLGLV